MKVLNTEDVNRNETKCDSFLSDIYEFLNLIFHIACKLTGLIMDFFFIHMVMVLESNSEHRAVQFMVAKVLGILGRGRFR